MAKALFAVALWLCTSLPVLAATPQKKPPTWGELTQEQQQILAPLAVDWDNLEPARKRKWLGIAKRYPKMKPDEQARAQRRMQAWVKLTPKERQAARERYAERRRRSRTSSTTMGISESRITTATTMWMWSPMLGTVCPRR